jgi:hypothetical protein
LRHSQECHNEKADEDRKKNPTVPVFECETPRLPRSRGFRPRRRPNIPKLVPQRSFRSVANTPWERRIAAPPRGIRSSAPKSNLIQYQVFDQSLSRCHGREPRNNQYRHAAEFGESAASMSADQTMKSAIAAHRGIQHQGSLHGVKANSNCRSWPAENTTLVGGRSQSREPSRTKSG